MRSRRARIQRRLRTIAPIALLQRALQKLWIRGMYTCCNLSYRSHERAFMRYAAITASKANKMYMMVSFIPGPASSRRLILICIECLAPASRSVWVQISTCRSGSTFQLPSETSMPNGRVIVGPCHARTNLGGKKISV